jgi:hypothetical protein
MRFPRECYQMHQSIQTHFGHLRPAQQWGLVVWVYGTILAQSCCQTAVLAALLVLGQRQAIRDRLRDWLYDGSDKSAPCRTQVEITACFAPLLRWLLSLWQGAELALAVDVTNHHDRLHVLGVSVLYRGSAIPVAWHILPGNQPGAWMPHLCRLLDLLAPAVPPQVTVLVLVDRGLRSPVLWRTVVRHGWHPVLRLQRNTVFRPSGSRRRQSARSLLPRPGTAWVGQGRAFGHHPLPGTLIVLWQEEADEPWILLTDLPPTAVGVCWYGLRVWIELGFRVIKSIGLQWQRTRRTDPDRVARHWLVLAVALLWITAYGTRAEDAERCHLPPARLRAPRRASPIPPTPRLTSIFHLGLSWLRWQLFRGRPWRRLWLCPECWPDHPPGLVITYHAAAP